MKNVRTRQQREWLKELQEVPWKRFLKEVSLLFGFFVVFLLSTVKDWHLALENTIKLYRAIMPS